MDRPHPRRKRSPLGGTTPNPMEEENFPDNPTRRAADREMDEPANVPGLIPERPRRAPAREVEDEDE